MVSRVLSTISARVPCQTSVDLPMRGFKTSNLERRTPNEGRSRKSQLQPSWGIRRFLVLRFCQGGLDPHLIEHERVDVGGRLHRLGEAAGAVPRAGLDPDQDGSLLARRG